jgi:hypothetical protein
LEAEHHVSAAVLRALSKNTKRVLVSNHRWQKPGVGRQLISIQSLRSHVLCASHNRALSPLDGQGGRLVRQVATFRTFFASGLPGRPLSRLYNGFDIERWMLKVLLGTLASRSFSDVSHRWRPPRRLLQTLFENAPFPKGYGLYVRTRQEGVDLSGTSIYVLPIIGETSLGKVPLGLRLQLSAFELLLLLLPPTSIRADLGRIHYRPRCLLVYDAAGRSMHLHFGWSDGQRGTVTKIRFLYSPIPESTKHADSGRSRSGIEPTATDSSQEPK